MARPLAVAPEFASVESFVQFMCDEDRTQYTIAEMRELGTSLQKTDMWVSKELRSWGLAIVPPVPVRRTRGFTTSSNDRWFGPGSSPCHGGSGADQINGFAGSAHSASANTTFGE